MNGILSSLSKISKSYGLVNVVVDLTLFRTSPKQGHGATAREIISRFYPFVCLKGVGGSFVEWW